MCKSTAPLLRVVIVAVVLSFSAATAQKQGKKQDAIQDVIKALPKIADTVQPAPVVDDTPIDPHPVKSNAVGKKQEPSRPRKHVSQKR